MCYILSKGEELKTGINEVKPCVYVCVSITSLQTINMPMSHVPHNSVHTISQIQIEHGMFIP